MVLTKNHSDQPITITKGEAIAQMIFERASTPLINVTTNLPPTDRGEQAFGHSHRSRKRRKEQARLKRRRGIVHTTDGGMYMDASNPKKPKCKKVNRPLSEGVKTPKDSNYYNSFYQWKSHKFSSDEDTDKGECFYQHHDPKQFQHQHLLHQPRNQLPGNSPKTESQRPHRKPKS